MKNTVTIRVLDYRVSQVDDQTIQISQDLLEEALECRYVGQALHILGVGYYDDLTPSAGFVSYSNDQHDLSEHFFHAEIDPDPEVAPDLVGLELCMEDFAEDEVIEGAITNREDLDEDDFHTAWTIKVVVENNKIVSQDKPIQVIS
jgi:hypothetical protein